MKKIIFFSFIFILQFAFSQEKITFSSLEEVLQFAEKNSSISQANNIQKKVSEINRKSAFAQIFNPKIPVNFSMIDNVSQQVSFIPAEIFGGESGTFRAITMGQQYVSTATIAPQFDVLNLGNIAKYKTAKINEELTESNAKMAEKALFDQLNATYYNVLSFKKQQLIVEENRKIAENIARIVTNRYKEGIVRQQDVNEAKVNVINYQDKISQIEVQIKQQLLLLQTLLDTEKSIEIEEEIADKLITETEKPNGKISVENIEIQQRLAQQELKYAKWMNFPTISLVSSFNWQQNSNDGFFNSKTDWYYSNYIGLRLAWDFPTTITKFTNIKINELNNNVLAVNLAHKKLQNQTENQQLQLEYEKSVSQYQNLEKITELKQDTYQKYYNQYMENILSLDRLLIAQNDKLSAELNQVLATIQMNYNLQKIQINNRF